METLNREKLKGQWVAGLFSGGLDSTTIVHWLSEAGIRVLSITVDLGQPDEKDINDIPRRMRAAGAEEAILIDGKDILAEYMLQVIQGQAYHEGGYWNTTGIARVATSVVSVPEMEKRQINTEVHGATGRGNDQIRLELVPVMLAPKIRVYAPWQDQEYNDQIGGRKESIEYCHRHGLEITATLEKPYSTDSNFCGLTHEAGVLEYLNTPTERVEFIMGVSPKYAPDKGEEVQISFKNGRPSIISADDFGYKPENLKPLTNFFYIANNIAGRNGIGIVDAVENRRIGIKSRGVYEAPGVTLLAAAYNKLLQLILDRNRRKNFDIVSRKLADAIYEGEWFSPECGDLITTVANVAKDVTGTVTFELYKGNILFVEAKNVPHSLYDPERSSMEKIGEFNHIDSRGYLNIIGVTARAMASAGLIRKP